MISKSPTHFDESDNLYVKIEACGGYLCAAILNMEPTTAIFKELDRPRR